MPYGALHAKEAEILVRYGGFSPLEAIVAAPRTMPSPLRLDGEVGELKPGQLADVIVLKRDPVADITVLQGGRHLAAVIKDGRVIDLGRGDAAACASGTRWREHPIRAIRRAMLLTVC